MPKRRRTFRALVLAVALGAGIPETASAQAGPATAPASVPSPAQSAVPVMDMSGMSYNANGVMSMFGMSKSGMHMDMSTTDPSVMSSVTDIGTPMSQSGSGTSWMPVSSTAYGRMWGRGDDMEMVQGVAFLRYTDTFGTRGTRRVNVPDFFMYMRTHPTSPATQFGFQAMLSSDFLGVNTGYPLIFQTGESLHGQPLHDVQHPHDLFSELSVSYSGALSRSTSAYLYLGYPGEPALGPPVFMHRELGYDYAPAPIGHHWQDATHIQFGVVTVGVAGTKFKIEGSTFTGREPNEVRTNFDPVHLDSYSARLSWNPNRYVAMQISSGYINSPEALDPNVNVHRTTASIIYERPLGYDAFWTQTLVFGQNSDTPGPRSNSFLYETEYRRDGNAIFARLEPIQKSGAELVLAAPLANTLYNVGGYTLGFIHDLPHPPGRTVLGLGLALTYDTKPASLNAYYGSGNPISFDIYLRARPSAMIGQDTLQH